MKNDALKIAAVGAVFSFVLILIVFSSQAGEARRSERLTSTYNAKPDGIKAFYSFLSENGYPAQRWRKKASLLHFDNPSVFVVVSPDEIFSDEEIDSVKNLVRGGSTLVVFWSHGAEKLVEAFGLSIERADFDTFALLKQPTAQNVLSDTLYLPDELPGNTLYDEWLNSLAPDSSGYVLLYGNSRINAVVEASFGDGSVVVFNSAGYITNQNALQYDNLRAVTDLLLYKADGEKRTFGELIFDEYHHGFKEYESVVFLLDQTPVKTGLVLMLIAALLWAYSKSKRIGRPVPVRRMSRRSSSEYVTSVSAVYMRAKAHSLALRLWYRWVLSSLSAKYRTNMENKLAEIMETRYAVKKEKTRRTLSVIREKLKDAEDSQAEMPVRKRGIPVDENELIILSKELDELYRVSGKRAIRKYQQN